MLQAIHNVKGRIRYRVDKLYRSESLKNYLELQLSERTEISVISANTLTSNVLIIFKTDISPTQINALIEEAILNYQQEARESQATIGTKKRQIKKPVATNIQQQKTENWHLMPADAVLEEFKTSKLGLLKESAQKNLDKYGPNALPEAEARSDLNILLEQFKSLPVALLGVAAGVSLFTGGIADALVIMGVVTVNAAIGYVTESQSERIINSLKNNDHPLTLVIRDGSYEEINAEDVVLGDILVLKPGKYVAADARLLEAEKLSIDESALTGESVPVTKTGTNLSGENIPLADRMNMVYKGTLVTGGQGLAVVVATGQFTQVGQIQSMVSEATATETPLSRQLDEVGTQLVLIGSGVCGVVFGIGLWRGYGFLQMLQNSISLAVAAVPEGLPTIATTILALGIQDMRQRNVLVRSLSSVEALGSVQTICMDKTGTITENRMLVVKLHTGIGQIDLSAGEFVARGEIIHPYNCDQLLKLIHVSVLCNESQVEKSDEHVVNGSSTENALIHMAINAGVNVNELRHRFPLLETKQRSENRNIMSTIHATHNHQRLVAVKGSPSEVIELCRWSIKDGQKIELTPEDKVALNIENDRMAGKALRVLGTAYRYLDGIEAEGNPEQELIWLGLVGMADPVRSGVKELIGQFHRAGIDTVMITGDQSPTAYAIGKELQLSRKEQMEILDSTDLVNVNPEALQALCDKIDVFARISPANKLQIVQALQNAGKVVAMTGDGINDAPALKSANVGVAMGNTGTDVAREVADIILEDDRLETMIVAVSQGRTIYNNIRKSVHFLLATNFSEIIVATTAIALGLGEPLNALQLLWLNLVSDIFPGLALALEQSEPDVLSQPPRSPDEPIIKSSDFQRITFEATVISVCTLAAYGYGIRKYGIGPAASTIAFMSLTSAQLLHTISCRSEEHSLFDLDQTLPPNQYLYAALGGSFALQLLTLVVPPLRSLLKITPIDLVDSIVIGSSALLPLLVSEATKKSTQPL